MALTDQFGVSLVAQMSVDRGSLRQAQSVMQRSFGGSDFGKKLGSEWQKSVGLLSQKLWPQSGAPRSLEQIRKASGAGAKETGRLAHFIGQVKTRLGATWHMSGLGLAAERLGEVRRAAGEAREATERFGRVFGGAGEMAIGGLGLAGLSRIVERSAESLSELRRTPGTIGVSAGVLQDVRGMAELAGVNPSAATDAVGNLQQELRKQRYGLRGANSNATYMLRQYPSLNPNADSLTFLKSLSRVMQGMPELTQRAAAEAFGVEGLLSVLQRGPDAMERWLKAQHEQQHASDDEIKQADSLRESYTGLNRSIVGLGDALTADLQPVLEPMNRRFADWINQLKATPGAMDAIATGATILGGVIAGSLTVRLVALTAKMTGLLRVFQAVGGIAMLLGPALSATAIFELIRHLLSNDTASPASGGGILGWVRGIFGGGGKVPPSVLKPGEAWVPGLPNANDPRGMIPVIRAAAKAYGIDPDVAVRVAMSEGLGNFVGDHGTSFGAFQLHTGGGLGDEFQKETGLDPRDPKNEPMMIDWALRNLYRTGWGPYHGAAGAGIGQWQGIGQGGRAAASAAGVDPTLDQAMQYAMSQLPAGYTARMTAGREGGHAPNSLHHTGGAEDWQIYDANGNPVPNRGADTSGLYRQMAVNALAWLIKHNPALARRFAWGGHFETSAGSGTPDLMHYDIGGPRGRFGNPYGEWEEAQRRAASVAAGADEYEPYTVPAAADTAAGNTLHQVEIRFMDAPPGMRSGLRRADGPAQLTLRTETALSGGY